MSSYLPSLYKARVPTRQRVCCICVDRTQGKTEKVRLGYGVEIWLCAPHASVKFQRQRGGRDFVLTLHELWASHGCLTLNRSKALTAHGAALKQGRNAKRARPGSYAWPELRRRAESAYASGATPDAITHHVNHLFDTYPARPPSRRTLRRWHTERRWLAPGPP